MSSRYSSSSWSHAPDVRCAAAIRNRRWTDRHPGGRIPALVVAAAVAVAAVPSVGHGGEADRSGAAAVIAMQDTLPPRPEPLVDRLRDRRAEARADSPRAQKAIESSDTTRADTVTGAPFPSPDSVMRQLIGRPGYRPVEYRGDTLVFTTSDRSIHIHERARLERAGEELTADSVIYRGDTRLMTAYGQSKLINAKGEEVTTEEGPFVYDTDRRVGTVFDGRTRWEIWNVAGNFTLEGNDTLWVEDGRFTSCDLPEPHYYFAADRIKMILGHIVVAWPVRLYFGDVPVLWFPFFAQDIRKGRHSGILTPRFGINDVVRNSSGYNRHISNIGYYWAINDYMDAQLGLDWWSDRWTRIDGFFRYRWRRQFLDGRLGYSQFFIPDGDRELSLTWNHSQKFGERSDLRASVRFVSSQRFRQQNEFDPEQLVQQIRSDIGFTRRFDWGTVNASGQRLQPLTEGRTTLDLPQVSVTFTPLVLFRAPSPATSSWYSNLTWTGSTRFGRQAVETPGLPDRATLSGGITSGWSLGNVRWNSSASYQELVVEKPDTLFEPDTVVIGPEVREGTLTWRSSVGYQQRLIGSTTLTPAVNIDGSLFRSNETGLDFVGAPTRVSMNATLNSDVFGFFPGFGPVQRIRHKISPSLRWTYSPEASPSAELEGLRGFNPVTVRERHQVSLSINQTFEAKLKPEEAADTAVADTTARGRPPEARKITLLALRTTPPLVYDFVEKRITTDRLENFISSDLLRGLTIRIQHDLFEERPDGGREFDPFLSGLNLSFSLGHRTFRRADRRAAGGIADERGIIRDVDERTAEEDTVPESEVEESAREPEGERRRARPWSLSVDYSLVRARPTADGVPFRSERQSIRANLGFSPTDNWTLSWRTQYDLVRGEFVDHALRLRRDLHRWSATFDFLRASNRNFLFEFRVELSDLPDIKFDYRQETRQ